MDPGSGTVGALVSVAVRTPRMSTAQLPLRCAPLTMSQKALPEPRQNGLVKLPWPSRVNPSPNVLLTGVLSLSLRTNAYVPRGFSPEIVISESNASPVTGSLATPGPSLLKSIRGLEAFNPPVASNSDRTGSKPPEGIT